MTTVTEMGGIIFPPAPSFYAKLESLDAMVNQTVGRVLDLFDIDSDLVRRWQGVKGNGSE
jgi:3-polyprenyl-4-hydroxybenzoate decarboxylase